MKSAAALFRPATTNRSSETPAAAIRPRMPFPGRAPHRNAPWGSSSAWLAGRFFGRVPRRKRERARSAAGPSRACWRRSPTGSATSRRRCASGRRRLHWRRSERASCAVAALALDDIRFSPAVPTSGGPETRWPTIPWPSDRASRCRGAARGAAANRAAAAMAWSVGQRRMYVNGLEGAWGARARAARANPARAPCARPGRGHDRGPDEHWGTVVHTRRYRTCAR
jgi:hypothetical protein